MSKHTSNEGDGLIETVFGKLNWFYLTIGDGTGISLWFISEIIIDLADWNQIESINFSVRMLK